MPGKPRRSKNQQIPDQWQEYLRTNFPVFGITAVAGSIKYSRVAPRGPRYRRTLAYFRGSSLYWYQNMAENQEIGNFLIDHFLEKEGFIIKYFQQLDDQFQAYLADLKLFQEVEIEALTDIQLGQFLRKVNQRWRAWHGPVWSIDGYDQVAEVRLREEIDRAYRRKFGGPPSGKDLDAYTRLLAQPVASSMVLRREIDLVEMIQGAQNETSGQKLLKSKGFKRRLRRYLNEYYWTKSGWGFAREYTKKMVLVEIRRLLSDPGVANKARKDIATKKDRGRKNAQRRKKAISELGGDTRLLRFVSVMDNYTQWHDWRKEGQIKGMMIIWHLHREAAKRMEVGRELLVWATIDEVIRALTEGYRLNLDLLRRRREGSLFVFEDTNTKEYHGLKAIEVRDKFLGLVEVSNLSKFKGIGLGGRKLIGRVRIVKSAEEAKKFRSGEILVTGMTTPDLVPLMKKAAAVITDEGGMTCHAAIICRELNLPGVVGTKWATRALETGQKVEVNPSSGEIILI